MPAKKKNTDTEAPYEDGLLLAVTGDLDPEDADGDWTDADAGDPPAPAKKKADAEPSADDTEGDES